MFFLSKSFNLHCFPVNGDEDNGSSSAVSPSSAVKNLNNTEDTDKNKSSPEIVKEYSFREELVMPVHELPNVLNVGIGALICFIYSVHEGGVKPALIFGAISLACFSFVAFAVIANIQVKTKTIQKDTQEAFELQPIQKDEEQEKTLSGEMNNPNTINTDGQNQQLI